MKYRVDLDDFCPDDFRGRDDLLASVAIAERLERLVEVIERSHRGSSYVNAEIEEEAAAPEPWGGES